MADSPRVQRHQRTLGAWRLRVTNLPASYATFAPGSATQLRDLIWDTQRVATHNVRTKRGWHSADGHYAYAFVETMTEADGEHLIRHIHSTRL